MNYYKLDISEQFKKWLESKTIAIALFDCQRKTVADYLEKGKTLCIVIGRLGPSCKKNTLTSQFKMRKWLLGKRSLSNENVITETQANLRWTNRINTIGKIVNLEKNVF